MVDAARGVFTGDAHPRYPSRRQTGRHEEGLRASFHDPVGAERWVGFRPVVGPLAGPVLHPFAESGRAGFIADSVPSYEDTAARHDVVLVFGKCLHRVFQGVGPVLGFSSDDSPSLHMPQRDHEEDDSENEPDQD